MFLWFFGRETKVAKRATFSTKMGMINTISTNLFVKNNDNCDKFLEKKPIFMQERLKGLYSYVGHDSLPLKQ